MDHAAEHLDPTAAAASSSAAVSEVNAWLASLAAEGGGGAAAPELSLGPDPTPRGVAYLRALAAASQAQSRAAGIAAAGLRAQAAEYRAEAARLREALERAGLARDALPPPASAAARAVAAVANLLAIRDTEMSSFVVASADLSLRRAEVEEKRDKIHKESKALLDYTWKAITKLTELKKMLEKFKNDVEKQQVEQMADWQTKLVMMDSKERQYILQVSNYKNQDQLRLAARQRHEEAGGPKIPMKYGRVDVTAPEQCPPEGRLPDAGPRIPAEHLREVFYRMDLDDKEIVALSGAHTLGRSRPDRSGWGKPETKYTKDGPGEPGGQSWTVEWLKFDNSYFKDIKEQRDQDLLVLPTDAALFEDPSFKVYAEKYAEDQEAFFKDYAEAHAKLSNLGAKFDPPEGFSLDEDKGSARTDEKKDVDPAPAPAPVDDKNGAAPQPETFVAANYSYGKRELSDTMKQKIRAEYEALGGSPDKPLQSNYFLNIMILVAGLAFLTSLFMS